MLRRAALAASTGRETDLFRDEPFQRRSLHALLQRSIDPMKNRAVRLIDCGLRLVDRYIWLQPPEQVHPVGAPVIQYFVRRLEQFLHRDWYEHVDAAADRRAIEMFRTDPDYRHWYSVDDEWLADDAEIGQEACAPIPITEYGDAGLTRDAIVARVDEPAPRRIQSQDGEVVSRHHQSGAAQCLPECTKDSRQSPGASDAGQRRLLFLKVAIHRIAEHAIAAARVATRHTSGLPDPVTRN